MAEAPALPQPENVEERLRVATCVVLLEAAEIDDEFTPDERTHIVEILQQRYDLSEEDAHELVDASTHARRASVDLWQFTNTINQACSKEEKVRIVEEAWHIILADGAIAGHEAHFARQLAKLFNLPHHKMIEAKVRVLEEIRKTDA